MIRTTSTPSRPLITAGAWVLCCVPTLASAGVTSMTSARSGAVPGVAAGETLGVRREVAYSDFLKQVERGGVASVVISGAQIQGELEDGSAFATIDPETDNHALIEALVRTGAKVQGRAPEGVREALDWLSSVLLLGLVLGSLVYLARGMDPRAKRRGEGVRDVAKSRARELEPGAVRVTFSDVAGIDEAKEQVAELVEFLKEPDKFSRLGGKIPHGLLMVGSPGTGKTLLARAIAGEAGVPYFTISGSDFVEMYVGVGARRVRDLFDRAESQAPCIVFIDEIDAVGRRRGPGSSGGANDEREQTLNQLLVRMDGFGESRGVIVIAATNRPDVLDPALLRPGRFDRRVLVPLPDVRGREQILRVHAAGVPLAAEVDLSTFARGTPGFSGADLANLVNEAALFAARGGRAQVGREDFDRALDRIVMGAERRSLLMSPADKTVTAYHEAGHAIVGLNVPDHDPVYKVSIMARGRSIGSTVYLPEADRYSHTRLSLNSRICALFGGRVAEALVFGEDRVTTGAADDLLRATEIARRMVTEYGMSESTGPLCYADNQEHGEHAAGGAQAWISSDTARAVDAAVREILERNYARARRIVSANLAALHRMAAALVEEETIDRDRIRALAAIVDRSFPSEEASMRPPGRMSAAGGPSAS